jgi:hypothetical protein
MKINYTHLATLVFMFLLSIYLFFLISCSAKFHQRKFIQKGGKIICDTTIVTVNTIVKGKDGKDSIIYREVSVNCPELQAPLTRYEIRYQYKTIRDTLKLIKYNTKYKYKEAVKTIKNDKKKSFGYNLRFLGIIAFLILLIVLLFKLK